jgi:hypothetical protein
MLERRQDGFVARIDSAGEFVWARRFGGGATGPGVVYTRATGLAVDGAGSVLLAGSFTEVADFAFGSVTRTLASRGAYDGYVAKLDSGGNLLWVHQVGGPDTDAVQGSLAIDPAGRVHFAGYFSGTASFGETSLTSRGGLDGFLAVLDGAGGLVRVDAYAGSQSERIWAGVALGPTALYAAGDQWSTRADIYHAGAAREVRRTTSTSWSQPATFRLGEP